MMQELNSMGSYPKECRNVAIADGNKQGIQNHQPGDYILNWVTYVCGTLTGKIWAYNGSGNKVFHGNIPFKTGPTDRFAGTLPAKFDNIPGATRPNGADIRDQVATPWYGWVGNNILCQNWNNQVLVSDFEDNPFIPTVSALNIDTQNWFYKASDIEDYNSDLGGLTHFEAYWAPDADLEHIETTVPMMDWLYDQVTLGEARIEQETGGVLTKAWNNPLQNNYIDDISINSGGTLYINADRPNFDEAPEPLRENYPPVGSIGKVYIGSDCFTSTVININSGGKMILGDVTVNSTGENNRAHVYITQGAEININAGGELLVNKNSKLVVQNGGRLVINGNGRFDIIDEGQIYVEEGGELVYEENAILNLGGYGSVAEFKGKITVGNNADFTYTGNGRFIFNQEVPIVNNSPQLADFWDIGTNASFTVHGPMADDDQDGIIECYRSVYLKDGVGNTFTNVNIEDGKMSLHEGAMFFSYSPTTMRYVQVTTAYPWQTHSGIRVWHSPGQNLFWFCTFSNGYPGLLLHWLGASSAATITGCDFNNCDIGLQVANGPFNVHACNFTDNGLSIKGGNLVSQSSIHSSDFSTTTINDGVDLVGQSGSSVNVGDCVFDGFDRALMANGLEVRSYCSEYLNNSTLAIELENSILNISEEARNEFTNNMNDIFYSGDNSSNTGVMLDQGYNDFAPRTTGYYIEGGTTTGMPIGGDPIPADNNRMNTFFDPITSQQVMPILITYTQSQTSVIASLDIPNNLTSVDDCSGAGSGTGQSGSYAMVESYPSGGGTINTANYPSSLLKDAALDAIDKITFDETPRSDEVALMRITEILKAETTSPDSYTDRIKNVLYLQMHKALNNSFQYGSLANTENEETQVNDTVQEVIDVIDNALTVYNPNDSSTYAARFRYTLDKSHVYRIGGYYYDALALLDAPSGWTFSYEHTMRAGYWQCVCEAEKDFFEEVLSMEGYINQMEYCRQEYAGYTYKSAIASNPGQKSKVQEIVSICPQPVDVTLNLEIQPGFEGSVTYDITDLAGRILKTSSIDWAGPNADINVQNLHSGAYLLRLDFNGKIEVVKFVKK